MSPGTEAFMLVCLEGYGTVWKEQFKLRQEEALRRPSSPTSKRSGPLTIKEWRCKFNMDNGQCRYGGWTAENEALQAMRSWSKLRLTENSSDFEMRTDSYSIEMRSQRPLLRSIMPRKKAKRSEYVPPEIEEIEDVWDEDE
jgi:hypothetical protein